MESMLEAQPVYDLTVSRSRCLYVRGINRISTSDSLRSHFNRIGTIESLKFNENPRQGFCWVTFNSQESADLAVRDLHHSNLNGSFITVRYELGVPLLKDPHNSGERPSACVPRSIKYDADGRSSKKIKKTSVSYTGAGILVDGTEYPSPQGTYLMHLLRVCNSTTIGNRQPLMDALIDARHGNKHAKELSESMAMVNAIQKLGQLTGTDWRSVVQPINVYTLADGKVPFTSIMMCLYHPQWSFTSIDPILDYDISAIGIFSSRITCVQALSQDFLIPLTSSSMNRGSGTVQREEDYSRSKAESSNPAISIVIACHSHAPLQEFWDRVPVPKYCVVMPCCGKSWSHLKQSPLSVYDDYEVFSPKRKIFLYHTIGD